VLDAEKLILDNATRSVKGNVDSLETNKLKDSTRTFSTISAGNMVRNIRLNTWAEVVTVSAGEIIMDDDIFTTVGEAIQSIRLET